MLANALLPACHAFEGVNNSLNDVLWFYVHQFNCLQGLLPLGLYSLTADIVLGQRGVHAHSWLQQRRVTESE